MSYVSFFDLKDRAQLERYFKMKRKHGFCFDAAERSAFMEECVGLIQAAAPCFDVAALPETSNAFLVELASRVGGSCSTLKKRSVESLLRELDGQRMMRAEREKLYAAMGQMKDFKINLVAGNQRRRFEDILFEPVEGLAGRRVLLLDDAVFGGSTQRAAIRALGGEPVASIALFSK